MKYIDYVDLGYRPGKKDLICEFFVEPLDVSLEEAAGGVAAESSIGTWTETTTTKPYVKKLHAIVFEINGNNVKIAYPAELFEEGNMPNIMSSIAGNVFGLKDLKNLRLNDIHLPKNIVKSFKGPKYGIKGIRNILKIKERPLIGTIIKPKLGLTTEDHAKVAYDAWIGGCDIVKDDENLSSQKFNKFEKRLKETFKMKEKAELETGEKKVYIINITAETDEMKKRAKLVEDVGNEYVMTDIITIGWSALQTLRNQDFELVIHAHRAGHAAFTKNPKHGISMKVIAKLVRIVGIDQLHVGTVVGKMFESKKNVLENIDACKGNIFRLKPIMPVASGGLHAGHVPELLKIFGNDVVMQFGGGIHSLGTASGAMAVRQAVEASMQNIPIVEYAKTHQELKKSLEKFGFVRSK
jgi:ribulose-bisphosphate carboxylase large chain